jgi:diguanylate cyclase (GGDEF)-like protein
MNDSSLVAVIVPDREVRDLICLNLRFDTIKSVAFKSLDEFLISSSNTTCVVLDVSNESYPKKIVDRLGDNFPLVLLLDNRTPRLGGEKCIAVYSEAGRKKFDAVDLVSAVSSLIKSNHEDPTRHPLTNLPSGSIVEKYITSLLAGGADFAVIASDMDNMKAFNQRFGYAEGDKLLVSFVSLLKKALEEHPGDINFLGHRGKDDFVIVTDTNKAASIAEKIVDSFDAMIKGFFTAEDYAKGYFSVSDRRGNIVNFPVTTVSLVIVNTLGRGFTHPAELYDVSGELMAKVKARGINQSYCAVDKRSSKTTPDDFPV